jgi:hypothetical protein
MSGTDRADRGFLSPTEAMCVVYGQQFHCYHQNMLHTQAYGFHGCAKSFF